MDEANSSALSRIMRRGALGVAFAPASGDFYINFEKIASDVDAFFEITFNPEYVILEGREENDVYLVWGNHLDVANQIRGLVRDLNVTLCPELAEEEPRRVLFDSGASQVLSLNRNSPWDVRRR